MWHTLIRLYLSLALCLGFASAAFPASFDHTDFDALLKKFVVSRDGGVSTQVDYAGFQASKLALGAYLDRTSKVRKHAFDGWPKSDQLAFLINVYNARTIELVLTGDPDIASMKDLGNVLSSAWKRDFIPLFGAGQSLDDIEHGLIRGSGKYNDPRIHFAANCASIGCPALRAEAYTADKLDAQLEDQTKKFLSDRSRNRIKGDALELSSIFKWYIEDFQLGFRGADGVSSFILLYADAMNLSDKQRTDLQTGALPIRHLKYDWRLNRLP
ncbi:MAG: DUF547 domain-containing protein [Allorhizobium sp.]